MKSILVRLGLVALLIGELAGCGGSNGTNGANGTNGTNGTNATNVTNQVIVNGKVLAAADFQALRPQIDPASISVSITPQTGTYPNITGGTVVKYKVTDQNGNPIIGLGGSATKALANDTNVTKGLPAAFDISFTLAKLIPAANGEPARWVNYLVTKPAVDTTIAVLPSTPTSITPTPASAVVATNGVSWTGQYPSADSNGTLIDNGDGTYQYTFLRDPTQTQTIINALPATYPVDTLNVSNGAVGSVKSKTYYSTADLDPTHLNFDANATTRLGILLTGSQPGTGTAVAGNIQTTGPNAVPLVYTLSLAYDFIPATGKQAVPGTNASREIVQAANCDGCHDNVKEKRGLGHISVASATNGIPPGAYVGRNDPRLCVACHTDQASFGYVYNQASYNTSYNNSGTEASNTDGSPAFSGNYGKVDPATVPAFNTGAFIYPRMIHQTHMGNQLVKTGYNLNAHATACGPTTTAAQAGANAAQCFQLVGMPQDQRNCTKCHTATAVPTVASMSGTSPIATGVTPDGDNWMNKPSQLACGACHDGINFITGAGITLADRDADIVAGNPVGTTQSGHSGTAGQTDNSNCAGCHTPATIATVHAAAVQTPNSVALQAGVQTVAYKIKSAVVNTTTHQPTITFQILLNGTAVSSLPVMTPVTNAATGAKVVDPAFHPLPNLIGGPSFTMYWAVPQDGIVAPADFNGASSGVALGALLIDTTAGVTPTSPAAGYLTNTVTGGAFQADSSGYFTAVLTGDTVGQSAGKGCVVPTPPTASTCVVTKISATPLIVPTNAVMVTATMIGGFTQDNLAAYPYTPADATTLVTATAKQYLTPGSTAVTVVPGYYATGATNVTACPDATPQTKSCVTTVAAVGTGLRVTAVIATALATKDATGKGYTARRVISSAALCNNCHDKLGNSRAAANAVYYTTVGIAGSQKGSAVYDGMSPFFHNGDRNDPTACIFCHNANKVDDKTGWQVNASTWLHGIHGASKRTVAYGGAAYDWSSVLYPGQLKDCNQCHLPNTVNFGATGGLTGGTLQPNLLWTTTTTGTVTATGVSPNYAVTNTQLAKTTPAVLPVPVPAGTYGTGWTTAVSGVAATDVAAAGTTLVNSPISSACFSCHTDATATNHMKNNGGYINAARSSVPGFPALANSEGCLACHGQGTFMDTAVIHQNQ